MLYDIIILEPSMFFCVTMTCDRYVTDYDIIITPILSLK